MTKILTKKNFRADLKLYDDNERLMQGKELTMT